MCYYDVALIQMGNMLFYFYSIWDSTKVNIFLLKRMKIEYKYKKIHCR